MKSTGLMLLLWIGGITTLGLLISIVYTGIIIIIPIMVGAIIYFGYKLNKANILDK